MRDLVDSIRGGADLRAIVQAFSTKKLPKAPVRERLTKDLSQKEVDQLPHVNDVISALTGGSTVVMAS
jgi:hypothetical protein